MNDDHAARLSATIEVMTRAVQFLLAERISTQPTCVQGDLLQVLQRALSVPPRRDEELLGRAAIVQVDLALWMPVVATSLIDDVRRQLGHASENATIRPRPDTPSEVAVSTGREDVPAVRHLEGGRLAA